MNTVSASSFLNVSRPGYGTFTGLYLGRVSATHRCRRSGYPMSPVMTGPAFGGVPSALRALDLGTLVGCTEQDARARVEAAGGQLRCYDADHPWLTADYRPTRVTARIEDGRVVEVCGFS